MSVNTEKVKRIRTALELSQEDFSQKIGIGRRSLCELEQGNYDPKLGTLENIAKLGNVSVNELLEGNTPLISNPVFHSDNQNSGEQHCGGVRIYINTEDSQLQQSLEEKDRLLQEKEKLLKEKDKVIARLEELIALLKEKQES